LIGKDTFLKKLRRTSQIASGKNRSSYLPTRATTRVCNAHFCQFLSSASGERIGSFSRADRNERVAERFTSPRYIVANRRDTKKRIIPFVKHRDSGDPRSCTSRQAGARLLAHCALSTRFSPRDTGRRMFLPGRWHCWPSATWRFAYGARSTYSLPLIFHTLCRWNSVTREKSRVHLVHRADRLPVDSQDAPARDRAESPGRAECSNFHGFANTEYRVYS